MAGDVYGGDHTVGLAGILRFGIGMLDFHRHHGVENLDHGLDDVGLNIKIFYIAHTTFRTSSLSLLDGEVILIRRNLGFVMPVKITYRINQWVRIVENAIFIPQILSDGRMQARWVD